MVFHGPREDVLPFFSNLGFQLPERKGIADFLQEIISKKDQQVCCSRVLQSMGIAPDPVQGCENTLCSPYWLDADSLHKFFRAGPVAQNTALCIGMQSISEQGIASEHKQEIRRSDSWPEPCSNTGRMTRSHTALCQWQTLPQPSRTAARGAPKLRPAARRASAQ